MKKKKQRSVFVCQQCGNEQSKWFGRCPECGEFETAKEIRFSAKKAKNKEQRTKINNQPVALSDVEGGRVERKSTGFSELDRVLGGGLVEGQAVLLAGEPGIGKSTLLLQVAKEFSKGKKNKEAVLYVCGEESPGQIKIRAKRLGIVGENIILLAETNLESILDFIQASQDPIELIIVDSIQSLQSDELTGIPGSVGQIKLCAQKLIEVCKNLGIPLFLVGQVTKEGLVAGPKVLEHIVDTVLYLEGERMEELRLMRSFKNRFGSVDELSVFQMGERGIREVADASRLFLEEEDEKQLGGQSRQKLAQLGGQAGVVLCPVVVGLRVLLVEIQSLVVPTKLANPRRVNQGFPKQRLEMISAVLQKHLKLPLYKFDIFVNVSGGLSIDDPAADLAAALSIYSSLKNKPLPNKTCAFGELTLLGSIRKVLRTKQRLEEVKRLGIKKVYFSDTAKYLLEVIKTISENSE